MSDNILSKHFSRGEFACPCGCGFDQPHDDLIEALEALRTMLSAYAGHDAPITITSGCRCPEHNAEIGGAEKSQHTIGRAADIRAAGFEPSQIARLAELIVKFKRGGIGIYPSWCHVDARINGPARWGGDD